MQERPVICKLRPVSDLCMEIQLSKEKGESLEIFKESSCYNCEWCELVIDMKAHLKEMYGLDVAGKFANSLDYLNSIRDMKDGNANTVPPPVMSEAQKVATKLLGDKDVRELVAINDKLVIAEGLLKQQDMELCNPEVIAVLLAMFLSAKDKGGT